MTVLKCLLGQYDNIFETFVCMYINDKFDEFVNFVKKYWSMCDNLEIYICMFVELALTAVCLFV
jgi:hypothetical protein